MPNRLGAVALVLIALAGGLFILFQQFPGALGQQGDQIRLVQGLLVLTLAGSGFAMGWNGSLSLALKQALVWSGALVLLLAVYAYRTELLGMGFRVAGVTLPTRPMQPPEPDAPGARTQNGAVYLRVVQGGHFLADAAVNGTHVRFLVDTGATNVALSNSDARRLRLNPEKLDFDTPVYTANGKTFAARVTLDEISIGAISRKNVPALVVQEGLTQSLLGMSFLSTVSNFEMGDGVLILRD